MRSDMLRRHAGLAHRHAGPRAFDRVTGRTEQAEEATELASDERGRLHATRLVVTPLLLTVIVVAGLFCVIAVFWLLRILWSGASIDLPTPRVKCEDTSIGTPSRRLLTAKIEAKLVARNSSHEIGAAPPSRIDSTNATSSAWCPLS